MTTNIDKQIHINVPAILFGALIGIGFWMAIAAFGGALGMSVSYDDNNLPSAFALTAIALVAILVLSSTFFFAGFIASRAAHQLLRFDSIIHSLATWAVMTILLVTMISIGTAAHGLGTTISSMKPPALVTDVEVFKGKATTTIETGHKKAKPTREEVKAEKMLEAVWWISFVSLLLGSGASISGGLLGRQRRLNQ